MYFLTTEKALHTFTLPTKFRGGYAALNQAGKIKYSRKKKRGMPKTFTAENMHKIKPSSPLELFSPQKQCVIMLFETPARLL